MNINNTALKEKQPKLDPDSTMYDIFTDYFLNYPNRLGAFLKKYKDYQQRLRSAVQQRDEAIKVLNSKIIKNKTKRRQLVRELYNKEKKIECLEWELDESNTWMPVRNIQWLKYFFDIDDCDIYRRLGVELTSISKQLGLYPRKIEHPKLKRINLYHKDAIEGLRLFLIKNPSSYPLVYKKTEEY